MGPRSVETGVSLHFLELQASPGPRSPSLVLRILNLLSLRPRLPGLPQALTALASPSGAYNWPHSPRTLPQELELELL